jgi:hypothetical protein
LCKHYFDFPKKISETDIFEMLEFLIDKIFALFGGCVFHHIIAFLWVVTVFPFSLRVTALLVRGRIHTDEKRKEASPIL